MPTMGSFSAIAPVEPWKAASPKEKIPPSDATIQYPLADGVDATPTIGRCNATLAVEPWADAPPPEKTAPLFATNQ